MSIRDVDYDEARTLLWEAASERAGPDRADVLGTRVTMVYLALATPALDFYGEQLPRLVALLDAVRDLL